MKSQQLQAQYQVVPYPKYQRMASAANRTVRHRPMIHGLLEVDVTRARALLRDYKAKTGEVLSFTAFLATCLAKAVDEHTAVQALPQGSKRLVVFEDVDICTRIERDVAGQKYVIPYIIRAATRKTFLELHDEIRTAQAADVQAVLRRSRWTSFLPAVLFRPFFWAFGWIGNQRPRLWKETMGTVGLTAVGMFGAGAGWGIPPAMPTALTVTVGGIGEKPGVVDGQIAIRDCLSLTISFDHDITDGAPAARFTQRLKQLIESGYGLPDSMAKSEQAEAEPAAQTR